MKPTNSKLWNIRGRVIEVPPQDEVTYLRRGYLRLTPEEGARYKLGDYSPIYDKGADVKITYSPPPPPIPDKRTGGSDTLSVEEV